MEIQGNSSRLNLRHVKLAVAIVLVALLTPATARAAGLNLQGTYDCKIHDNVPLNTGQVFVDATLTLVPVPGFEKAFQSGILDGMKTTGSLMPLSVITPEPYTNTLAGGTYQVPPPNGDGIASLTLDWRANSFDFPAPDECLGRITKTGFPKVIESFILACFDNRTFPFSGECNRR